MDLKLTDKNLRTYGNFQWTVGVPYKTSGKDDLCGPGWIHYYHDATPELCVALNPLHANFPTPRLWRVDVGGQQRHGSIKSGTTSLTLLEELPLPTVSLTARTRWVIYCVRAIPKCAVISEWETWANRWLSGVDRSESSAWAAVWAARSVKGTVVAWSAVWAAQSAVRSAARSAVRSAAAAEGAAAAAAAEEGAQIDLTRLLAKAIEDEA